MNILGLSCYYHDAAACLIRDGVVLAAAQEERFNRSKNSPVFPINAVNYCVQESGIAFCEIDLVAFYEKPFLKFYRVILEHLQAWPFSFRDFLAVMPEWLNERMVLPLTLEKEIAFKGKTFFIPHHLSHAASAFLVSPFEEAAILTCDGVGEWSTLACATGRGSAIKVHKELRYPDSLGLLYSALTAYLGFSANREEGTVMALAGSGEPAYLESFRKVCSLRPDGSFMLNPGYLDFIRGEEAYSAKFVKIFGPRRNPGDPLEPRHADIACSLQRFTEQVLTGIVRNLSRETGLKNLCLAGGSFLNCVANSKILEDGCFEEVFVQPAAGDAGGALGAAAYVQHSLLKRDRCYVMEHSYLGPAFSAQQVKRILLNLGLEFREYDPADLSREIAARLAGNQVVGWFQGRMEFGPRALGNRSILANPGYSGIQELLNAKVKKREPFRPYAPAVLEERAQDFFLLRGKSPFMSFAPLVKDEKRGEIPGAVHSDGTARVQTVNKSTNPRFWQLIKDFEGFSGLPMLLNTSFNLKGEPMVCSPEEAIDSFRRSQMDCLVLENCLILRKKPNA